MQVSLERELNLQAEEEHLVPTEEEPHIDAKQLHAEDPGVDTSTYDDTSRDGRKCSREDERLMLHSNLSLSPCQSPYYVKNSQ